jgi:hypothetical protein
MVVHNGGNHALQRLKALAPRTHIVALAPHVAAAARERLGLDVEWAMAAHPFKPKASGVLQAWVFLVACVYVRAHACVFACVCVCVCVRACVD